MPKPKLYFVSSNAEKYREIRGVLAECTIDTERIVVDLPEIQSLDPAQVAAYKAQKAYEHIGHNWVLVEDTGLAIDAWNGYPGALIKWVLGAVGEAGLCRQLDAWKERSATATVALCLYDGYHLHTFTGQVHGVIAQEPRGDHGFGWDSIFCPDGFSVTYGEMLREEKMQISMRTRALDGLRDFLLTPLER